jgi:hypothetical protein
VTLPPQRTTTQLTGAMTGGMGDAKDVEVSYDGTRLLLPCVCRISALIRKTSRPEDLEYDIAAESLRRIISSDITAEDGQDVAPHYPPDGRIIFSSTRQRLSKSTLLDEGKPQFSALDEDQ